MAKLHFRRVAMAFVMLVAMVLISAPNFQQVAAQSDSSIGVVQLTGTVTVTNTFQLEDTAEPFMALIDLTAFIKRDHDLKLPFPTQTITGVKGDLSKGAKFAMQLPIEPQATLNNVSNGKSKGKGVAVFALDYDTNTIGDAFLGPYEWAGWPGGLDSLKFSPISDEVYGGRIVVWSPDAEEMFPTGFGTDGKLFTKDDPVGPVPQGWTVVDLETKPFEQIRTKSVEVPIVEGENAQNDLSKLTYTQAFDALVKDLRVRYAFTDFKKINWNGLITKFRPQVVKAEQDDSLEEFNVAMLHFAASFHDGHVAVDPPRDYFTKMAGGGVGLVLGYTSSNQVIVRNALEDFPAAKAGIKKGAQILQWNGVPIQEAIDDTEVLFTSASSPQGILQAKLEFVSRSVAGTEISVRYENPGEAAKTAHLTSVSETDSLALSTTYPPQDPTAPPVERYYLGRNLGLIRVNTFIGDSILMVRSWESALRRFKELGLSGLIIDVRSNGGGFGGLATYFAGSFYKDSFVLNESLRADPKTGIFHNLGKATIDASPVQWDKPVAVLIGPECASACEIFSAAMAHDPNHLLVGMYPTSGVEGGVAPWTLPGGLAFQAPIIRFQYPDGRIFLEQTGVPPTVQVPLTVQNLTAENDVVLIAAAQALQQQTKLDTPTPVPSS